MAFAFSRLYNEFAWAYDKVSCLASSGEWPRWQKAALPRLRGPRVLEIGFGTGDLLSEMRGQGYLCYGVELSPSMLRIAKRKGVKRPSVRLGLRICLSGTEPSIPWSLLSPLLLSSTPGLRGRWFDFSLLGGA